MNQTRLGSLYEALINVAIGYSISFVANLIVLNGVLGLNISLLQNLWIGAMFTAISVARTYVVRRWFNAKLHAFAQSLPGASA